MLDAFSIIAGGVVFGLLAWTVVGMLVSVDFFGRRRRDR
jgi:hypothetical protein